MEFIKNYSLSIVLITLFIVSWVGQYYFQYRDEQSQAEMHNQEFTMSEFTDSFLTNTFENWQSEFLQLATMVILTSKLSHKGSPESKDSEEKTEKKLNMILDAVRKGENK
ncbi:MAG TPA: hypothetical protein PKU78_05375 [Candidatus Dojkabacteria bacterium]|nr:hypothetical protein [Candidatus Dojkabacteria bacterium]HRO65626.1 hypothetical protein [Candidatus Dojkabacteria bacterium]HRP37589.1 hypothetical protein [Candidatus Dojkabacteria bacterium]HRP50820.1 hypothetical protein [Candidatus Dojkabacteria bacterium]